MKVITNLILRYRELWVEAQWVTQVLYYNDSEEENWSYVVNDLFVNLIVDTKFKEENVALTLH